MGIVVLQHGDNGEEWALEVGGAYLLLRNFDLESGSCDCDIPPSQLAKWDRLAEELGMPVEDVVKAEIHAAFMDLRKQGEDDGRMSPADRLVDRLEDD
jgi:hypothetical protein